MQETSRREATEFSNWYSVFQQRRGAWVAQSLKHPTLAHVMIRRLVSSRPASDSVLTAWSLEPAFVSLSVCRTPPPTPRPCSFSLSLSNGKQTFFFNF